MKVLIADKLSQAGVDWLAKQPDVEVAVKPGLSPEELAATVGGFDGMIIRSGVKVTEAVLADPGRLRCIARAGVGVDNVDVPTATARGIIVMNTPGGNTVSTAELTWALMLAMSRKIVPANVSLGGGAWERKKFQGTQLAGKTLGIVGMGRIGQAVASRALALEMNIIAYDPFLSSSRAKELGVEPCSSVSDMLGDIDYLTVHTPLNDDTRGLIGPAEVKKLKPGARLINCARGGIYDEEALLEGLASGHLGGVALDVYPSEPCTDSPLFGMQGVLCTPHLGASTEEAQTNVAVEAAELLIDFFATGTIRQSVNMSPLDAKTLKELRGHLDLAYRLGMLLSQVDHNPPTACRLSYTGEVSRKDTRLLSAAFAAGLLERATDEEANIVNASVLLKERGIELVEQRSSDTGNFNSLITAEVISDQRTSIAAGTLFGNRMPRLVRMADCNMESYLDGILLVFAHRDMPGIIGKVGSIFGSHRVNIAQMAVGRTINEPGGEAMGVLSLDSQPPAEALAELLAIEHIAQAWTVNLPPAGEMPSWMGG